ncbi:Uu.00g005880.m01.CDS01 [Anthostomella pinea]|uniref:Uu.00g005880.m01.CDS01 n=1 Tax=Anthostomella pinea TaxID=933095 RepID=A0AAI8VEV6_9PEZI|nr:Uu.00g005880.m01.CDS01 [Anthostomella pinea]
MVSFKRIFFFGAALTSLANAIPAGSPPGSSLSSRATSLNNEGPSVDVVARSVDTGDDSGATAKRQRRGRMTLQWSPQGRIFFLLGASFPQSIIDGFYGLGEAGPAKGLLDEFHQWLLQNQAAHRRAWLLFLPSTKGGVYGKAGGAIANDFGFGLSTSQFPTAQDLQDLLDAITAWASQAGSVVQALARPNGFFDPAQIGAGQKRDVEERSRTNTCPADMNLLQYATEDVSVDVDIANDFRWGGECDES